MGSDLTTVLALPGAYWLASVTVLLLLVEAIVRLRDPWALPAAMVYLTIVGWYILEPLVSPEPMVFQEEAINSGYLCVFFFLAAFRGLAAVTTGMMRPRASADATSSSIPIERVFYITSGLWIVLLLFGMSRMEWDVLGTLFPVNSRSGVSMWQRAAGADAGPFGFLVATAGYTYTLILSLFGMLLPLLRRPRLRALCIALILISWPYAFLQGSRNVTLAVCVPLVFSMVFFGRARPWVKLVFLIGSFIFIEWSMRAIITYRNVGFESGEIIGESGHYGLSMASELIYSLGFIHDGVLRPALGMNTLADLANIIPRPLWPSKPLIGIDYAIARGYSSNSSDIGVFATIATGVIGQGVLEFGTFIGPLYSALLMAIWVGLLSRFRAQKSVTRTCLFLLGLGLTFNLGRGISLLVLWPMLFAYLFVVAIERFGKARTKVGIELSGDQDGGEFGGRAVDRSHRSIQLRI